MALPFVGSKMEDLGVDQQNRSGLPRGVVLEYSPEEQAKGERWLQGEWQPDKDTGTEVCMGDSEESTRWWQLETGSGKSP